MLDRILSRGTVYDGTGVAPFVADIGISGERIAFVGDASGREAGATMDIQGLVVAPGFIDGHTHGEGYCLDPVASFSGKVAQGVTAEILGNCGISVFPIVTDHEKDLRAYFGPFSGPYHLEYDWTDLASLRDRNAGARSVTNIGSLAGHGSIRIAVMGFENRAPAADELRQMEALLAEALEQGAVGLSLGLIYPPGLYAGTEELVALSRVAARYGRPVTAHLRSESFQLVGAVTAMLDLAEQSGCTVVISHHKAIGRRNWGRVQQTLALIDRARSGGLSVYCDAYPYTAGNTVLRALLPPWALEGGIEKMLWRLRDAGQRAAIRDWIVAREDWENMSLAGGWDSIVITATRARPDYEGRDIASLATERAADPIDFLFDVLLEEEGGGQMLLFMANEDDLQAVLQRPYCMVASDGIPLGNRSHPRVHGTFPRFLARYVLGHGLMPLQEGIRRITGLPAQVYHLAGRGTLVPGAYADMVVFDPATLTDTATYQNPTNPPRGIHHLLVGGHLVILKGSLTGIRAGQWL